MIRLIPLNVKLVIMVLVPAIGTLMLAITDVRRAEAVKTENAELLQLAELSVRASALVHELQKERGMSAGYIGSNGVNFDQEILGQYELTDGRAEALTTYLANFDAAVFGAAFQEMLDSAVTRLEQRTSIRPEVRALDLPLGEALGFYTGTNAEFLGLIGQLPKLSSDGEVGIAGTAYIAFLQSKERAGIERAVLANTFARDAFAPGLYDRFQSLVTVQSVYLDQFRGSATSEHKAALIALLASDEVAETDNMRAVAKARYRDGGFGIASTDWFAAQTRKINLLKDFEDQLSEDLRALAIARFDGASAAVQDTMRAAGIPLVIAVLIGGIILVSTLRQLGTDPRRLERVMRAIANDDLDTNFDPRGKAKGVFGAAMTMQQNLRERIDNDRRMLMENGRIREALTNVSGNVMIAGEDHTIIYANDVMLALYERMRPAMQLTIGADAQELLGTDINVLHQNAGASLGEITSEQRARITFGQSTVDYVANPVVDAAGVRIGTVFEWNDRTDDLAEEQRVSAELAENGRIRQALDNVDGMVMIADTDQILVYANRAMTEFAERIQPVIAGEAGLGGFASLVGYDARNLHERDTGIDLATLADQAA
ncbi:MAG: nitrate- and nitrite sensing domain-containing protein, partial [Pseudomonadota bacterium]